MQVAVLEVEALEVELADLAVVVMVALHLLAQELAELQIAAVEVDLDILAEEDRADLVSSSSLTQHPHKYLKTSDEHTQG